jgi:quinol monooxygenase YgiN
MAKTALIVKMTAAEGKRDEVMQAFESMFAQVEAEDGTELYVVHEDSADANVLWIYELYTDGDALGAHSSSDAMAELMGVMGAGLIEGTEMSFVTPARAKGIEP